MSQQTSIGNLNNMNEEDSNLVDSILNDLNSSQKQAPKQMAPQQQNIPQNAQPPLNSQNQGDNLTPEQIRNIQIQRQMAMQQQQQNLMNQMNQQKMKSENLVGNLDEKNDIIDNIKKESKNILLVIVLSLILNLEQVDNILRLQSGIFVNEGGQINIQGILLKSLVIGVLYYLIKFYLF